MAMATLIFFIYSCPPVKEYELDKGKAETSKDLDIILKEGKLRVSTTYSETSSFLYRGQALGFEYELLQRFADYLGVEIEIVVAVVEHCTCFARDDFLSMLVQRERHIGERHELSQRGLDDEREKNVRHDEEDGGVAGGKQAARER